MTKRLPRDLQIGLVGFLLPMLVYSYTAAPGVGAGHDTGELTVTPLILGIPHAPGYPLYVMLGHIFGQLLFWGEPAWRLNIFSALCLSVGCGFFSAGLSRVTHPLSALTATWIYAFGTAVWRQAVAAEVFALHLCFLAMLLYLAIGWSQASDERRGVYVLLASFVLGLGLAHHHTLVMAGPGLLAFGILSKGRGRAWGFSWWCLPVMLVTASMPYLFMLYLAQQKPAYNWGNPSDWEGLVFQVLRKAYGSFSLNAASNEAGYGSGEVQVLTYIVTIFRNQFPFPLILLVPLGMDAGLRADRRALSVLFTWMIVIYGPLFALLGNQPTQDFFADVMDRFYASSYFGLAGFVAMGLDTVVAWLRRLDRRAVYLVLLAPLFSLTMNWAKASQRGQYHPDDIMQAIYNCLPKNSFFILEGDLTAGVSDYMRLVKRERPDLFIILPGLIGTQWYQRTYLTGEEQTVASRARQTHQGVQEALMRYRFKKNGQVWMNYPGPGKDMTTGETGIPGHIYRHGLVWQWFPVEEPEQSEQEQLAETKRCFDVMEAQPKRGDYHKNWRQNFWTRYFLDAWIDAYRSVAEQLYRTDTKDALTAISRVNEMMEAKRSLDVVNEALLRIDVKDYETAYKQLSELLELDPDHQMALAAMVDICKATGRTDEAAGYRLRLDEIRQRDQPQQH